MSLENVETVLEAFRAFQRRDEQALFAPYAADVVGPWWLLCLDRSATLSGPRRRPVILSSMAGWLRGLRDGRVVVTVVDRAKGKRSGVPIERVHGQIWTFRDGMVVRVQIRDSRRDALEAVGLTE